MNKYWIIDKENQFWCRSKMKPSNSEDIPRNYRMLGYWSRYTESYDVERRVQYLYLFAQLQRFMMWFLSRINTKLVLAQSQTKERK